MGDLVISPKDASFILGGPLAQAEEVFLKSVRKIVVKRVYPVVANGLKIIAGSVFSLSLILVVIAGAELFTGSCLMVLGSLSGKVSIKGLLRNWALIYLANFVGCLFLVALIYHSGLRKAEGRYPRLWWELQRQK